MADTAYQDEERRRRNKQPLLFCKMVVSHPRLAFVLTLSGHFLFSSLNFFLYISGYDILPVYFDDFQVHLKGTEAAQREYAWRFRDNDSLKINHKMIDNIGPTWDRGQTADHLILYYTKNGENIFTKEILTAMQNVEQSIFTIPAYQSKYCQLGPVDTIQNRHCNKPHSILRYFDGTLRNISSKFYDPKFDRIAEVLHTAYTNPKTKMSFPYFLGKGYSMNSEKVFSNITRTAISFGLPLTNDSEALLEEVDSFLLNRIEGPVTSMSGVVDISYFSRRLLSVEIPAQALRDIGLTLGSFCFIFLFMWFETRSFFITLMSVTSILSSLCITNLVYRILLDYRFFGYIHIISIFIILGIGADNIFVFYNTWRASGYESYPSKAHRLSDCYRRASGTMLFTSLTTMTAFLSGGLSPLSSIGSFGIFSGVLVAVNFISVIVYLPTVIIFYDEFLRKCCRRCQENDECVTTGNDNQETANTKKRNIIVVYFKKYHFWLVTHKVIRWVIIVLFGVYLGVSIWSATRLEVDVSEVQVFRAETNLGKAMKLERNAFIPSGDNFVVLYLVWGMKPRNFSECHFSEQTCLGKQAWDDHFDMNSPPAQVALKEFCSKLKNGLTPEQVAGLKIRNNTVTGDLEVDCWMDNLQLHMKEEEIRLTSKNHDLDLDYPLTALNMDKYMRNHSDLYEPEKLPKTFYRYFEVAVSHWLTNGYAMTTTSDTAVFSDLIGERRENLYTRNIKTPLSLYGNQSDQAVASYGTALRYGNQTVASYGTALRYVAIRVHLTLPTQELNYIVGIPIMDLWEEFVKEEVSRMPVQLKGGFQCTEGTWHWIMIQKALVDNAVLGMIIGICVAFPVLVLATCNVIVGFFATLNIAAITVCVLGVIPMAGWKIDMMVSVNLCLVVGLSVDYVVHLAEGYTLSAKKDRLGRVQDTLEHVGISVVSGAVTTIGAAAFMVFGQMHFNLNFGTFLICTIGFSLFFSLFFFTTIMAFIGPQGETGSIKPPFRFIKRRFMGRSRKDIDCTHCDGKGFVPPTKENDELETSSTASDISFHWIKNYTQNNGISNESANRKMNNILGTITRTTESSPDKITRTCDSGVEDSSISKRSTLLAPLWKRGSASMTKENKTSDGDKGHKRNQSDSNIRKRNILPFGHLVRVQVPDYSFGTGSLSSSITRTLYLPESVHPSY